MFLFYLGPICVCISVVCALDRKTEFTLGAANIVLNPNIVLYLKIGSTSP